MQLKWDTFSRNKYAISFEEVQIKVFPISAVSRNIPATIRTKQSMETILSSLELGQFTPFCIQQQSFHLKIFAAGKQLTRTAIFILQHPHREYCGLF